MYVCMHNIYKQVDILISKNRCCKYNTPVCKTS